MKILIVSQYYYPEQFQINEIAPELVKRGHEVTVLTGLPNYPQGEIYEGYNAVEKRTEEIDGVKVIRTRIHPRKHGALHLIWNYISFAFNGSRKARQLKEKFDIVFAYQLSPVTSLQPAIAYKKKYGVPLLAYCLDIWPESAKAHVRSNNSILYRYIAKLSKRLYQQCDHIAVTSQPFIDYHRIINEIQAEKMNYIPQHADDSYLSMDLSSQDNGIADFMYAGNLGQGQRVDVIIRAAAEIRDETFIIHIVGDGSAREELEKLVQDYRLESKIIFYGNQKREDMPNFYRKADALLITLRGDNFVGYTLPGKLQIYMACGKPIFGAINGATNKIITNVNCGACVKAEDYKGLSILMHGFIKNKNTYKECGKLAKKYFKDQFTLDSYLNSVELAMRDMTK